MTVQPNTKSTVITYLDATPPVRATAGQGGSAEVREIVGILPVMTTGDTAGGIMRAVRVPSNCSIKKIEWANIATVSTVDCDVGLYYSDTADGTSIGNQAGAVIDADFFASAVDMKTVTTGWTDITFEAGTYLPTMTNLPIWDAVAALTVDPGGYFDIALTNTSTTSGVPVLCLRVTYTMPC